MQLNDLLNSSIFFLENLGYARFTAFGSSEKSLKKEILEKISQAIIGLFALLATYDFFSPFLSVKVRRISHGTLCILISCIGLSYLLKIAQKILIPSEQRWSFPESTSEESIEEYFFREDSSSEEIHRRAKRKINFDDHAGSDELYL